MSLLAGGYFIIKSTLVLLITILTMHLNNEMILPLYSLFALIIFIINKYSISLIKHASLKKVLSYEYYITFASFMSPVYPKSHRTWDFLIFSGFLIDCSQLPVELMVSFNDPRILGLTFIRYKSNTIDFVMKCVFLYS